jgi:hypothetical protein
MKLHGFLLCIGLPEIVNRYDLWVIRHKIGGAKVFENNVQWSDQMM